MPEHVKSGAHLNPAIYRILTILKNGTANSTNSNRLKYLFFFLVYLGQNTPVGFTWLALPVVLRSQGYGLGTIGMLAILYSPWAFKFLYSWMVDRYSIPVLGRRRGWLLVLRGLAIIVLFTLSQCSPGDNFALIFMLIFIMNFLFALSDIAVDGYSADIFRSEGQTVISSVQVAGDLLGFMVGGGVFLILYNHLGWQSTLYLLSIFIILLSIPIVTHCEIPSDNDKSDSPAEKQKLRPNPLAFLKKPMAIRLIILFVIMAIIIKSGFQVRLSLLTDLGFTPSQIGFLTLWAGSPLSICGTFLGIFLFRKIQMINVFTISCFLSACLALWTFLVCIGFFQSQVNIAIMVGLEQMLLGILMSALYLLSLKGSVGSQSATDYGILGGVHCCASFGAMMLAGGISEAIGYNQFYIALTILSLLFIFPVRHLFQSGLSKLSQS